MQPVGGRWRRRNQKRQPDEKSGNDGSEPLIQHGVMPRYEM
jgi:hypothetical protein